MNLRNGAYSFNGMNRAHIGRLVRNAAINATRKLIVVSRSQSRATAWFGNAGTVNGRED
jgi:hypothetical protein